MPIGNNPTITAIQNYDTSDSGGLSGINPATFAIDWDNGFVYVGRTDAGIRKCSMSNFGQTVGLLANIDRPMTCDVDGNVWTIALGGAGSPGLFKIDPNTLTQVGTVPLGFLFADMVAIKSGGTNIMIGSRATGTTSAWVVNLDAFTPSASGPFIPDQDIGFFCISTDPGCAYGIYGGGANGFATAIPFRVYKFVVAPDATFTVTELGTLGAGDIQPGWTHLNGCSGIIADEASNDILVIFSSAALSAYNALTAYGLNSLVSDAGHDWVSLKNPNTGNTPASSPTFWRDLGPTPTYEGSDGVSHRVAKVRASALPLTVPWRVVTGGIGGIGVNASRIRYSKYCVLDQGGFPDGHRYLHQINTITGQDVKRLTSGMTPGNQVYNDFTGMINFNCGYDYNSGIDPTTPAPNGTTPTSWATQWATLGSLVPPFQPPAPPPSSPRRLNQAIHYITKLRT